MATHSSVLAWEIPWTEETSGLQSMGSQRVRHNLATEQQQIKIIPRMIIITTADIYVLTFQVYFTYINSFNPSNKPMR